MNDKHDQQFDAELDRDLKDLPELTAPESLVPRVMAMIHERAAIRIPWYRQPWPLWPAGLRTASFVVLLVFFGAVCFAGWRFFQTEQVATALHGVGGWLAGWGAVFTALKALVEACGLVIGRLGPVFLFACLGLLALSYFTCVGLSTAFVRFAFVRQQK